MATGQDKPPPEHQLQQRLDFLRKVAPFARLSDAELTTFSRNFRPRHFETGDTIFHQGDRGRSVFVVRRGIVRFDRVFGNGHHTALNYAGPGHLFGEFSAISRQTRVIETTAVKSAVLLEMPGHRFLDHMRAMPELAMGVSDLLIQQTMQVLFYLETILHFDVGGRLLRYFLYFNDSFGVEEEPGKRYHIDLPLTQSDLAMLVGSRREWVNRILQEWRRLGLVEHQDGRLVILDLPAVQALLDIEGKPPETAGKYW